jgi:hypothetical protein
VVLDNEEDEVQNLKNSENFLNNEFMEANISSSSDDGSKKNYHEEIVKKFNFKFKKN